MTMNDLLIQMAESASRINITTESRDRMAEMIARELLAEMGDNAYTHCVERLANNTEAPRLWRGVLKSLDEMKGEGK